MASKHYTAAMAAIANMKTAQAEAEKTSQNMEYLLNAVLTTTSTIAKNRKQQAEMNEFALVYDFVFDKETNAYYSTSAGVEGAPFQIAKIDSSTMSAFKDMEQAISLEELIYDKTYNSDGDKVITGLKSRYIVKDLDVGDFNRIANLDPWKEEGIPTSSDEWQELWNPLMDNWENTEELESFLNYNYTPITADDIHTQGIESFDIKDGRAVVTDHPSKDGDIYIEMIDGKPALVNREEAFALNAPFLDRSTVESQIIKTSKKNLKKENKDYPEIDEYTGLPKYESGGMGKFGAVLLGASKLDIFSGIADKLGPWGLALMGIDWVAGAAKKGTQYRAERNMLQDKLSLHKAETAQMAGIGQQKDLDKLTKDYQMKTKAMTTDYGEATQDLMGKIGSAWQSTKGLYTSQAGNIQEEALKRLNKEFSESQESMQFQFENSYDQYLRGLADTLGERQIEHEDMYQKLRFAKKHDTWEENLV